MTGNVGVLKVFPNNIFQPTNDFLSILPVAQNATNCLYMPTKGNLTPSPVREVGIHVSVNRFRKDRESSKGTHVRPHKCKGDDPEIGAANCSIPEAKKANIINDLIVNDTFKERRLSLIHI